MSDLHTKPVNHGEFIAVVDLGSNSFYLVVARVEHDTPRIIDRLRDNVQMAAGLDAKGSLDTRYSTLALDCLARFGQRIAGLPGNHVRAVATSSVRSLTDPQPFLNAAEAALGHRVEVVSGHEEGRLIFQGVAHGLPPSDEHRLVIDVGGGSTEFVIGCGLEPLQTESVQIGCIASTRRFFSDIRLTPKHWQKARNEIGVLLQQFAGDFRDLGWRNAYGSSGSAKAIHTVVQAMHLPDDGITPGTLAVLRDALLEQGYIETLKLPGLGKERTRIIAGAVVILETVLDIMGIDRLHACENSMREGLLWDLLGRAKGSDPRTLSINRLAIRHDVDQTQARRVEATALMLFDQLAASWQLGDEAREWLIWVTRIHEIGLTIAHSQHHHHGSYIVRHTDLSGFSRQEQTLLGTIIAMHRRKPDNVMIKALPPDYRQPVRYITAILRLAVLLQRSRRPESLPKMQLTARGQQLHLQLPYTWLQQHPLTAADLDQEIASINELELVLNVSTMQNG